MKILEVLDAGKKESERKKDLFFTGLSIVDKTLISGIEPGELMIVSGTICAGKTSFCISAAMDSVLKNKKALYLTSSPVYLANRLINAYGTENLKELPFYIERIEGTVIEESNIQGEEEEIPVKIELLIEQFAVREPVEETKDMDPMEMYTRDLSSWLLIIDPIDYVYKYYPKQGQYGALRRDLLQKYIKGIKRLAKKFNAAVIITAMALETESGDSELSSEAASCAPLAEVLCLLEWEDRYDLTKRRLSLSKNIHEVRSGSFLLGMDRETGVLKNYTAKEGGK